MARLRHNDSIKAVGTTGKRSVMLALVVALVLQQEEKLHNLSELLREHGLEDEFWDLLESAKVDRYETSRNVPKDRTGTAENIDLQFICDRVPVLSLNQPSVFFQNLCHGFCRWLCRAKGERTICMNIAKMIKSPTHVRSWVLRERVS